MRILLVDRDLADLTRVDAALRELGHEVVSAKTEREAIQRLELSVPEVALVDGKLPPADTISFIKAVRARARARHVYVYVLNRDLPEAHLEAAYLAGCDGEIPKPTTLAQLRSRLAVAERLLTRLESPNADADEHGAAEGHEAPAPVLAEAPAGSPLAAVTASSVWQQAPGEFKSVAATFLMLPFTASNADTGLSDLALASGIVLSNPEQQIELRIGLGVNAISAEALTVHMFGEHSPDLESDMLGELANMFMGALKDGYSREAVAFTGGLPQPIVAGDFLDFFKGCQLVESYALVTQGARIAVRMGAASQKNVAVTVGTLREGMVLAADVFNMRGMLLVKGGTRLSATMANRLKQMMPGHQSVDVAPG